MRKSNETIARLSLQSLGSNKLRTEKKIAKIRLFVWIGGRDRIRLANASIPSGVASEYRK